jgi:hypothetical protein
MTAVELLKRDLDSEMKSGTKMFVNWDMYLEVEKKQHGKTWDTALDKYEVRAGNYMRAYEDFDDYYSETYVNNHIVDTNEMIDHIGDANKMVEAEEKPMRYHCVPKELPSDEDIMERAGFEYPAKQQDAFIDGAKWYREQLKLSSPKTSDN